MNLIKRTYHNQNDTTNVRKSQRVSKKPKFLDEYVIDDFEDCNMQHPDMDNVVGSTENNDVRIIFDRLISFVEQWQQELIDTMEKVDHDGDSIFSIIINKHVTNYSSNDNDVIEEASTCNLSIDIKRKSPDRDEFHSNNHDIIKLNCIGFDGMESPR